LLGRWEVKEYKVWVKDTTDASPRLVGQFGEGLAYVFYDNGTYDGCIQAGSDWDNAGQTGTLGAWNCSTDKAGRWELEVHGKDGDFLTAGSYLILDYPAQNIKLIYEFLIQTDKELLLESPRMRDGGERLTFVSARFVKK
jgi:hypothetical protein